MIAIEITSQKVLHQLWLKCDSQLVICALKDDLVDPWWHGNIWWKCMILTKRMNFISSHNFLGGNSCVHKLASFGLTAPGFNGWDLTLGFIGNEFYCTRQVFLVIDLVDSFTGLVLLPHVSCFLTFPLILMYLVCCRYNSQWL